MGECKPQVITMPMINEWTATFAEFKGVAKPGPPPFSGFDTKETLTKWLVLQMCVGIIAGIVNCVMNILNGYMGAGIQGLIQGVCISFILAWVSWFMLVKREPNCCCFCIIVIEGWKLQHLVYGVLMMLQALSTIGASVNMFLAVLSPAAGVTQGPMALVFQGVSLGVTIAHQITWFFIAWSAIKIGGKMAGVEIPDPSAAVGKGEASAA